jgi:putative OPT family oligopeptide transporter
MAGKATALMVGTAVCIAASIAGDTSQDLKTGFILGATPYRQQMGELIGVLTSAGFVCLVIIVLNQGTPGGLGGPELPAPQAVLMKLVVDGVLDQNLPWTLIYIGVGIALVAAAFKVPVLPFAVGVYLPLSTMGAVFLGGLLRWSLTRDQPEEVAEPRREKGVLFGSGLVGGGGLTGVVLAVWVVSRGGNPIQGYPPNLPEWGMMGLAALTIGAILFWMRAFALSRD